MHSWDDGKCSIDSRYILGEINPEPLIQIAHEKIADNLPWSTMGPHAWTPSNPTPEECALSVQRSQAAYEIFPPSFDKHGHFAISTPQLSTIRFTAIGHIGRFKFLTRISGERSRKSQNTFIQVEFAIDLQLFCHFRESNRILLDRMCAKYEKFNSSGYYKFAPL